jgi:two-component system, LytTR family, response regulator
MITKSSKEKDDHVLLLPNTVGKDYIRFDTIVRCEGQKGSCIIYLNNENKQMVCKTINFIEKKLPIHMFIKVQPLQIVNLSFINRYINDKDDYLVMHDGTKISISNSYRKLLNGLIKSV